MSKRLCRSARKAARRRAYCHVVVDHLTTRDVLYLRISWTRVSELIARGANPKTFLTPLDLMVWTEPPLIGPQRRLWAPPSLYEVAHHLVPIG